MDALTREEFLKLSWDEQKATDLRRVVDPECVGPLAADLVANCIGHDDSTASMVIYANAVWCFGCKRRWWPDQFLRQLGDRPLVTERGSSKQEPPKFIPIAVADTYRRWLWGTAQPYSDRQQWLLERGLTRETCNANYIGHTGEAYSIPVTHVPEGGGYRQIISIRYRRDDGMAAEDRPKYWGTGGANQAMLYVPDGICDKSQYGLILCEGELDALRLVQEGYPAVSLTNGCNALKDEHLPKIAKMARKLGNRVTVCYDQDGPGRDAGRSAADRLSFSLAAKSVVWPVRFGKDVTELLQQPAHVAGFAVTFDWLLGGLWR